MPDAAQGVQKGPTLGRYHLLEPIGGGPTGEVFRAKVFGVAGFEKQFAVKKFFTQLTSDRARAETLSAAARAYQTVEHPRVARLHEYSVVGPQHFVAVELASGIDLRRLIAATHGAAEPVAPGAVLSMIAQVARALAYVHGRGLLHVGLCPTNIVVSPEGDPKVMDFGFLRARLGDKPAEDPTLAARLAYLAPEQLAGGPVSAATDVFQLAVVAHEFMTGQDRPASGPEGGQLNQAPVPPAVTEVLVQALSTDVAARFESAGAFADALDGALRKARLPGGRKDLANAVRRVMATAAELQKNQLSGAVSFSLPAPPPVSSPPAGDVPEGGIEVATDLTLALDGEVGDSGDSGDPEDADATRPQVVAPDLLLASMRTDVGMLPLPPSDEPETRTRPVAPVPTSKAASTPPPIPPDALAAPSSLRRPSGEQVSFDLLAGPVPGSGVSEAERPKEPERSKKEVSRGVLVVLLGSLLVAGGYAVVTRVVASSGETATRRKQRYDPPQVAAVVAAAVQDAAAAPDGAPAPPPATPPATPDEKLRLVSEPPGAFVYLDGALKGATPLELPGSGDRFRVAFLMEGYKLHRAEVAGGGTVSVALDPVAELRAPAGIKVRCRSKRRFHVTIDGRDTGRIAPTERIHVPLGDHTVEVYDAVTDQTTSHRVKVADTHNSVRIKLEE